MRSHYSILTLLVLVAGVKCLETGERASSPFPSPPALSLALVENQNYSLTVHFFPKVNSLEFAVAWDLGGNDPGGVKEEDTSVGSKKDMTPQKITLGFDSGQFVDVVAMSFLPADETEGGSIINMESEALLAANDQIQDFHWSKKDGVLIPDTTQNYELISFEEARNGSFLSMTLARPWLTCDGQDIQFSTAPVEIWWLLEFQQDSMSEKGTSMKRLENLEDEAITTMGPDSEKEEGNLDMPVSPTKIVTIKPVENSIITEVPEEEMEAEILKSFRNQDFQGPVTLYMDKLLQNFTHVVIKECEEEKEKLLHRHFFCPLKDYRSRKDLHPRFHISSLAAANKTMRSTGDGAEFCPNVLGESLTKALTGKTAQSGKEGSGDSRGKSGRNTAPTITFAFLHFTNTLFLLVFLNSGITHFF